MAVLVWTLAVVVLLRSFIFLSLVYVVSAVHGIVNSNSMLLTLFLSLVAPLPPAELITKILECVQLSRVMFKLHILRLSNEALRRIKQVIHFPVKVVELVLVTLPEESFQHYVNILRFIISAMISTVTIASLTPIMLFATITRTVFWFLSHVTWWVASCAMSGVGVLFNIVVSVAEQMFPLALTLDITRCVIRNNVGMVLAMPGMVLSFNYLLTGYFYPGSFVRFQACARHTIGNPCYSGILESSFCCWLIMRTSSFIWIAYHHSTTASINRCWKLFDSRPQEWMLKFLYLIGCGAVFPMILDSHCFEQCIHNVLCTLSQLIFMVFFNYGFIHWQPLMVYHGVTALFLNLQSVCVSVYDAFTTLQMARIDYGVTSLYAVQLYLHVWVSFYMSKMIIKKTINPDCDVLLGPDIRDFKISQHME